MSAAPLESWSPPLGRERREVDDAAILGALPALRYRRGFQPACGEGGLTARLGLVCEQLIAMDPHPRKVIEARRATCATAGVEVHRGDLLAGWPAGRFDLIVLVDLLTGVDDSGVTEVLHTAALSANRGATMVIAHTTGDLPDHCRSVADVHARVLADVRWDLTSTLEQPGLSLDVLIRR